MRRLPAIRRLVAQAANVANSVQFLVARRGAIQAYGSLEDYATAIGDNEPAVGGHEFHFMRVRNRVLEILHRLELFVSWSAMDDLLFSLLRDGGVADPVRAAFERIRDSGVHHPGFVVYPVHSFGILGAGLLQLAPERPILRITPREGTVLTCQLASMQQVHRFLESVPRALGIRAQVQYDADDVRHYRASRSLEWLERNPLLAVRVQAFSSTFFDIQFFLRRTLEFRIVLVQMMSAFQDASASFQARARSLFSTRVVNNFETLDIRHYLIFQREPGRSRWDVRCVPMNVNHLALAELTSLSVELDPEWWSRRRRIGRLIADALDVFSAAYFADRGAQTLRGQFLERVMNSLVMFRRSFHPSPSSVMQCIALAAAAESLVCWTYARGSTQRVVRRVRGVVRGLRDAAAIGQAIEDVFQARNEGMHAAAQDFTAAIRLGQRGYAWCFIRLMAALPRMTFLGGDPLAGVFRP